MRAILRRWLLDERVQQTAGDSLRRGLSTSEGLFFVALAGAAGWQWWSGDYAPWHINGPVALAYAAYAISRMGAKEAAAELEAARVAPTLADERHG